ncbi:MAG: VCBS repeat-containing protein [SAR324 cluster bacterium]|nr:VCBS repeat-containing protein [SAR324 cluster bacterium]
MKRNPYDTLILKIVVFGGTFLGLVWIVVATPSLPFPYRQVNVQRSPSSPLFLQNSNVPDFQDHTLSSGLLFEHRQRAGKSLTGLDEVTGSGACALDFDQDGWLDLFLVNGSGQTYYYGRRSWWQKAQGHRLFRNSGNAKFEDVTVSSGIALRGQGIGCVSGDFDNDGAPDLLVTHKGSNSLLRNNGDGTFSDLTIYSGISGEHWSASAALTDFDLDGDLDIYVVNYLRYERGTQIFEQNSSYISPVFPAFNPDLYDSESNRLYRNMGSFKFENYTAQAGVEDAAGKGLAALWSDLNNDHLPDLFVVNDRGSSNVLFLNQGKKGFKETLLKSQVSTASGSRGIASGDIDNDGDLDFLLSSPQGLLPILLTNNSETLSPSEKKFQLAWFEDQARARNLGVEEVLGFSGWGTGLFDFNNDGWLDAFIAAGLRTPSLNSSALTQGQSNLFWLNRGGGIFQRTRSDLAFEDVASSRGTVFADFDNNGTVDIYVVNNNDFGQLMLNQSVSGNWFGVQLQGVDSNRDAVGAKVWLRSSKGIQYREMQRGSGSFSSNDPRLHFGLGTDVQIEELKIRWPDGDLQRYQKLPINQYLSFVQGEKSWDLLYPRPGDQSASSPQLENSLNPPDPGVAKEMIRQVKALEDPNVDRRMVAFKALMKFEAPESVRWLLRVFNDPDPELRCALAETFSFFFREEEALPFRKNLAIPHLLRMLTDEIPQVRICAARALGDAEAYQSLDALIDTISDPVDQVQIQAVRALGLLRDRRALPSLFKIIQNPHSSATLKAQTFIALQRLNAPDLPALFKSLFPLDLQMGQVQARSALETFKILFSNDVDGVVFNYNQLTHILIDRLQQTNFDIPLTLLLEGMEVVSQSGTRAAIVFLKSLLKHPEEIVRLKSYQLLFRLDLSQQRDYALQGLKDPSLSIRQTILENNDPKSRDIPAPLLFEMLKVRETRLKAVEHLAFFPNEQTQQRLWSILTSRQESIEVQLAVIDTLIKFSTKRDLPTRFFSHYDDRIRASAIRFWAMQQSNLIPGQELPEILGRGLRDSSEIVKQTVVGLLIDQNGKLAKQILEQLLFSQKTMLQLRIFIMENISRQNRMDSFKTIFKLIHRRHDPIHLEAVSNLSRLDDPRAEDMLWKILNDSTEQIKLRKIAAEGLSLQYPERVHKIVQSLE